ncbi:hypothetical protein JRO89_XS11G0197600 [Xanthoceras sorbifolium]|uniref:Disease resistance R13L4/SHOC-2-like LRR domain-containing protein n=1 Tax=Xanthoceras sorbifolium TaxID=99658 RepID=A0ABQ8HGC3_9ROSI|nr:hypothetical protein JRO89_XS11G0197600 [Xanthoceras sorbifolium]
MKSRRHAVLSNIDRYFASRPSIPRLRSLLLFYPSHPTVANMFSNLDVICGSFKLLRVLDLENTRINHLQSEIGNLINLRYLGLKNTRINKLPSSMRYLQSLQTLDISGNVLLHNIANIICKMENVRHLYINASTCTGKFRIDTLKNLQTLSCIHIDNLILKSSGKLLNLRKLGVALSYNSDVNRFCNSIAVLEQFESLRLVSLMPSGCLPSLEGLSQLHSLIKLSLKGRIEMLPVPREFPPNIAQLTLHSSFLRTNPMDVLKHLPKLSILRLRVESYLGDQLTISAGGFPLLRFLELENLGHLKDLTIEDGATPRLRHLRISGCPCLKELPVGIMSATTLQELEICSMPSQFVNRLRGEHSDRVKHIPSITFS